MEQEGKIIATEETLRKVSEWMSQGYYPAAIAEKLKISTEEGKRICTKVIEQWREKRDETIDIYLTKSLTELELLKHKCWKAYDKNPTKATKFGEEDNLEPLKLISACIERGARIIDRYDDKKKLPLDELAAIAQLTKAEMLPPKMLEVFATGLQDLVSRVKEAGTQKVIQEKTSACVAPSKRKKGRPKKNVSNQTQSD